MGKVMDLVLREGRETRRKLMMSRRKCMCACMCVYGAGAGGGGTGGGLGRWAERRQITGSPAKLEQ